MLCTGLVRTVSDGGEIAVDDGNVSALGSLGLSGEHLAALAEQGNLRAECSRLGKRYYKLRFRMGGSSACATWATIARLWTEYDGK